MALFRQVSAAAVVTLLGLMSGLASARLAAQQQPANASLPVSLERIRAEIEKPAGRSTRFDGRARLPMATFKTSVEQRTYMLTFEERLAKEFELNHFQRQSAEWGAKCCGIDVGALLKPIDRALQQRKTRRIREQIARELAALKPDDK